MNAYHFSAWVLVTTSVTEIELGSGRRGRTEFGSMDRFASLIVCGDSLEAAQHRFGKWLVPPSEPDKSVTITIRKLFAASVMDCLFTESGTQPLDWKKTVDQMTTELESTAVDDFEQGYWLDVNEAVRAGLKISSVDELRESLDENARSGLNWSTEKQFFFLLTVFSPPAPPAEPVYDEADAETKSSENEIDESSSSEPSQSELLEQQAAYPQLAEKEVAAIIRARNSAVAAWLWRNYAATTPLNANAIRIDPLCSVLLPEEIDSEKTDS